MWSAYAVPVSIEEEAVVSREQCRLLSWLEMRRDNAEIPRPIFKQAVDQLLISRRLESLAVVAERHAIPAGFAAAAPLNDRQRHEELDRIESGLRRNYLNQYAGRHVVDNRFVVLHLTDDVRLIVMSLRQHASFGTRVWAQAARFALPELENAMVRLHRDLLDLAETESVTSLHFDIAANVVVVGASEDIQGLQTRLRRRGRGRSCPATT